jgi:hypothetical protein
MKILRGKRLYFECQKVDLSYLSFLILTPSLSHLPLFLQILSFFIPTCGISHFSILNGDRERNNGRRRKKKIHRRRTTQVSFFFLFKANFIKLFQVEEGLG